LVDAAIVGCLGPGWLVASGLVVGVCRFYMLYLVYLKGLPMLLSVPASCHCEHCFCRSPYAVPTAYLRSDASYGCQVEHMETRLL
jgi:hypothetical protein